MTSATSSPRVAVVTVTYGEREPLLREALQGCLEQEPRPKVVVVDNGARWRVNDLARDFAPLDLEVIGMGGNQGPGRAFGAGIRRANELGVDFIWLLDDDNRPEPGALATLLRVHERETQNTPRDKLALLAFRPGYQVDVTLGTPERRQDSFRGFHVLDVPAKLLRRARFRGSEAARPMPEVVAYYDAPYSGVFVHRSVVDLIGLPREDFVLYGDDTEYTSRIRRVGGRILLVIAARLRELESSWNAKARFDNRFDGMLAGGGDFLAYYYMRNGAFVDANCRMRNPLTFWINRTVYTGILYAFSRVRGRQERYELLRSAMAEGLAGRLGTNEKFPLP